MLDNAQLLLPAYSKEERQAHKDRWYRLKAYVEFLNDQGLKWDQPNLASYENYLLYERKLRPASARAHLASIRGRYDELLDDTDQLRQLIRRYVPQGDLEPLVRHLEYQLRDAVDAIRVPLKTNKAQSRKTDKRRLTADEAKALLSAPDRNSLEGQRDLAVIALMLGMGVREAEIVALQVSDLQQETEDGQLALRVPAGTSSRERRIPYGAMRWVLQVVQEWLDSALIEYGFVFPGSDPSSTIWEGPKGITRRTVQRILQKYPIFEREGRLEAAKPLDLRRTYAQHLYDAEVDLEVIQQYLGLKTRSAVLDYIVVPSRTGRREPPQLYNFDLTRRGDIDTENPDEERRGEM